MRAALGHHTQVETSHGNVEEVGMETQATPHAPAARPMGKHGHPGGRGKAGHSSDAACSMRRMALRQAQ